MIWVWTAVVVVTLVLEFVTSEMISIWFSAAGIVALILAILGVHIAIQCVVFAVVAIILLFSLRKICMKLLKTNDEKTNADSLIGKKYILMADLLPNSTSEIKVGGIIWTVVGEDDFNAKAGEYVYVCEIKGNKLVVKGEK